MRNICNEGDNSTQVYPNARPNMVWPLDLQRLYYVGPGDTQALDSMCISGTRGRKSATEKLKKLRSEIQMMPDAKGIGSLFAKTAVNGITARCNFYFASTGKFPHLPNTIMEKFLRNRTRYEIL